MCKILCIGHAAYDITYPADSFLKENLKYETESFIECGGGPAANAAVLLSSWGIKTAFAGVIGNDYFGTRLIDEFKNVGTDITLLEQHNGTTPLSFIIVNTSNGSRTIINKKDKKLNFNININTLKNMNPEVLLFDGHEPEASLAAIELFPKAATMLDAGSLRKGTKVLSGKVDYLVASKRFALSESEIKNLDSSKNQLKCLRHLYTLNGNSIVTLGEKGIIYMENDKVIHLKAFPAKAVDTTGAGDIFHGAFAYGLLKKMQLREILKLSSITAATSVEKLGGRSSIPSLDIVMKIFESKD